MPYRLKKDIVELGLTPKEATVYLCLLNLGAASTDVVAKETKLNRSTTYVQINTLIKKGLVSSFKKGKQTCFVAESPTNLERLLNQRMIELEVQRTRAAAIIPELMEQFVDEGARPAIRVFEGKEGLVSMRNEILEVKSKKFQVATSNDQLLKIFTEKELQEFSNRRSALGIFSQVLYNSSGKEDIKPLQPQELRRVSVEEFPFSADTYIYDEKVAFAAMSGHVIGVIIESQSISQTLSKVFAMAWEMAGTRTKKGK